MKISILIPCHNEEKSIERCIWECLNQTRRPDQIVVVDDASTDNSVRVLEGFGDRITLIKLEKNTGNKSYVQQYGLSFVEGDIFIATDADSILDKEFVSHIENDFSDSHVVAVSGYVKSLKYNWLTAVRELNYFVDQEINKVAQANLNFLYVIPGCASAFRTEFFRRYIRFDHDTITEDLDFSYQIHKKHLRINYDKKAVVYTQDPADIASYANQLRRWYGGGFQNLAKHYAVINMPACAFELSLMNLEGMVFSFLLFALPFISITTYLVYIAFYIVSFVIVGLIAGISRRRIDLLFYSPLFLVILYVNAYVFLEQIIKQFILKKKTMVWFSPARRKIS